MYISYKMGHTKMYQVAVISDVPRYLAYQVEPDVYHIKWHIVVVIPDETECVSYQMELSGHNTRWAEVYVISAILNGLSQIYCSKEVYTRRDIDQ